MNTKTLTFILSFAALLAGGVVGAGVATAMSAGSKPQDRQKPATIDSASSIVPDNDAASVAAAAKKKASRLDEIHASLEQCFADSDAEPAKLYAFLGQLSADDLQAILQSDSKLESISGSKDMALHFLFKIDPGAATQYVMAKLTAPDGGALPDLEATTAMGEWTTADPTHALQWATSQSGGGDRQKQLLVDALSVYAQNDPRAALQAVSSMKMDNEEEKQGAFYFAAHQSAEFDLPDALAAAQSLPPGNDQATALSFVLMYGATIDPKMILNLALQRPIKNVGGDLQEGVIERVAHEVATDDPELVLTMAKNVADPKQRAALVAGAMPALTQQDPHSAWTFANTQFAGAEQLSAIQVVSHDAARNNPDMVAGWITQMPDGANKNRACEMLLAQWSDQEPDRAAAWVQQLPDDQNKMFQISWVVSHWAQQDPVASAQWLDTLPSGKARDNADVTYAWKMVSTQPSAAFDRAAAISDPVTQQKVLGYLYKREVSADPGAANAWLQKSNLPDDVKQKIIDQGSK